MLVPWTGNEKREFGLSYFCSFFPPSYCLHDPTPAPPGQPHCLQFPKCGTDATVSCEWFSPSVPVCLALSPIAKILGKVGESLSRICCVRPPVERFTFVGKGARTFFTNPSSFLSLLPLFIHQTSPSTCCGMSIYRAKIGREERMSPGLQGQGVMGAQRRDHPGSGILETFPTPLPSLGCSGPSLYRMCPPA